MINEDAQLNKYELEIQNYIELLKTAQQETRAFEHQLQEA